MKNDHFFFLIGKLRERSHRFLAEELEKWGVKGLAPTHGSILNELLKREGMSMQELAAAIGRDKSTVTALVDKLEEAGYVRRSKSSRDSRITRVHLREAGRALGPVFSEISDALIGKAYRDLSEWEQVAVIGILEKISNSWD